MLLVLHLLVAPVRLALLAERLLVRDARRASGMGGASCGRLDESVLEGLLLDLLGGEQGQLLGGAHVGLLLDEALGEDDVDLLEGSARGLGIEPVDDGQEAGVDGGEEQVGAPTDVGDHDGRYHDDEDWAWG